MSYHTLVDLVKIQLSIIRNLKDGDLNPENHALFQAVGWEQNGRIVTRVVCKMGREHKLAGELKINFDLIQKNHCELFVLVVWRLIEVEKNLKASV